MNLNEIDTNLEALDSNKKALLNLIDIKIENDMEKVLNKMDLTLNEIKRVEDKMETQFKMLMWVMGILFALILALKLFS
jgi:exosome complex RNA-binding protein Rrp4